MLSPNGLTHYFSFQMGLYTLVILSLSTVVWRTENGAFYILSLQTFSWVPFYSFNRFWLTSISGAAAPGWTGPSAAHALWCRPGSKISKWCPAAWRCWPVRGTSRVCVPQCLCGWREFSTSFRLRHRCFEISKCVSFTYPPGAFIGVFARRPGASE